MVFKKKISIKKICGGELTGISAFHKLLSMSSCSGAAWLKGVCSDVNQVGKSNKNVTRHAYEQENNKEENIHTEGRDRGQGRGVGQVAANVDAGRALIGFELIHVVNKTNTPLATAAAWPGWLLLHQTAAAKDEAEQVYERRSWGESVGCGMAAGRRGRPGGTVPLRCPRPSAAPVDSATAAAADARPRQPAAPRQEPQGAAARSRLQQPRPPRHPHTARKTPFLVEQEQMANFGNP